MLVTDHAFQVLRALLAEPEQETLNTARQLTDADMPAFEALLEIAVSVAACQQFAAGNGNPFFAEFFVSDMRPPDRHRLLGGHEAITWNYIDIVLQLSRFITRTIPPGIPLQHRERQGHAKNFDGDLGIHPGIQERMGSRMHGPQVLGKLPKFIP